MTEIETMNFVRETEKLLIHISQIETDIKRLYDEIINTNRFDEFRKKYTDFVFDLLEKEPDVINEEEPCFVYYILNREKDRVKIGISSNPLQRAKSLQTASGHDISIAHVIEFKNREEALQAEKFLHDEFYTDRVRVSSVSKSCEWFLAGILDKYLLKYYSTADDIQKAIAEKKEKMAVEMDKIGKIMGEMFAI